MSLTPLNLDGLTVLELKIVPDISRGCGHASLAQLRAAWTLPAGQGYRM